MAIASTTREKNETQNSISLFRNYDKTIGKSRTFQRRLQLYLQQEDNHLEQLFN